MSERSGRRRAAGWAEHTVTEPETGATVEEILRGPLDVSGRMIQRLTRARGIHLNGRPAHLSRSTRAGDVVAARVAPAEPPGLAGVEMELRIVHEDSDVLVLDKPPGMLVHPVGPDPRPTLSHGVAYHLEARGIRTRVRPVHRIDRDTSGLVLFALDARAHQRLDLQLRERTLSREYLAFVQGVPEPDSAAIDAPIARDPLRAGRRRVHESGDAAVTRYRVAERFPAAALLSLSLETGRTHQIRVHLAHVGHPVLGDPLYGVRAPGPLRRQALHASRLAFRHPSTGTELVVEAPLPRDLEELRTRLRAG
jgi:23S rRNA pseudouridine1911/1915/1917 synthase